MKEILIPIFHLTSDNIFNMNTSNEKYYLLKIICFIFITYKDKLFRHLIPKIKQQKLHPLLINPNI